MTKVIHLKEKWKKEVDKFIKEKIKGSFIAFQIRTGSGDFKDELRLKKDISLKMIKLGNEFDNKKTLFIASDSKYVKQKFVEEYNGRTVYYSTKAKHYDMNKNDYTSIIEHEVLSRANYLVLTRGSSYGYTALFRSKSSVISIKGKYEVNALFYPEKENLSYYYYDSLEFK